MIEKNKLAACPFCGGDAESDTMQSFRRMRDGEISQAVSIYCTKCTAQVQMCHEDFPKHSPDDLLIILSDAWNIRIRKSATDINELAQRVHAANIKWWQDIQTGQPIKRNKGELLALIHSEISEALEGERKDLMDDKLPHRKMAEVELVDAIIRILDYAAGFGYDLQGAFDEKMAYNATREDHKHEARRIAGGKQF